MSYIYYIDITRTYIHIFQIHHLHILSGHHLTFDPPEASDSLVQAWVAHEAVYLALMGHFTKLIDYMAPWVFEERKGLNWRNLKLCFGSMFDPKLKWEFCGWF